MNGKALNKEIGMQIVQRGRKVGGWIVGRWMVRPGKKGEWEMGMCGNGYDSNLIV